MRFSVVILALAVVLVNQSAPGLSADKEQPILIEADAAVVDDRNGKSTFTGNVTANQGTLHIAADKIEIYSIDEEITRIVASSEGSADRLAHYEQIPDEEEQLVEADARVITYFVKEEKLRLIGNARLRQTEDSSLAGEQIEYFMNRGLVTADSQGDQSTRVKTIYKRKETGD